MVDAVLRARRRKGSERRALAAVTYASLGWPVCAGAFIPGAHAGAYGRACSCDRVGCPSPGAHPLSPAWKLEATASEDVVKGWWRAQPQASILLVTGRVFDVLDLPARAGLRALDRLERSGVTPGPVALSADRALFFVSSRAAIADDDEWWSCHLDCVPEAVPAVTGLRWHCKDSYVVAPPSRLSTGVAAQWLREPLLRSLPDALRLLEHLADACEESPP